MTTFQPTPEQVRQLHAISGDLNIGLSWFKHPYYNIPLFGASWGDDLFGHYYSSWTVNWKGEDTPVEVRCTVYFKSARESYWELSREYYWSYRPNQKSVYVWFSHKLNYDYHTSGIHRLRRP